MTSPRVDRDRRDLEITAIAVHDRESDARRYQRSSGRYRRTRYGASVYSKLKIYYIGMESDFCNCLRIDDLTDALN